MTKARIWALAVLATIAVILFARFYDEATLVRHLDSVFLLESVNSILATGKPVSATVASWPEVAATLSMPPEQLCALPLGFPALPGYNVLENHAYLALYPIALLAGVTGTEYAFALLNAVAHLALVFLPYVFLRRGGMAVLPALVFPLCMIFYPGWSLSASGDYYLDRLYMPFMLMLLYLLHGQLQANDSRHEGRWLAATALVAIAAASCTERAALMVMVTLLFFWALFPALRRNPGTNRVLPGLSVLLALYLWWYFSHVFQGFEGGGGLLDNAHLTPSQIWARLHAPGMLPFALTNLLFVGWMVLFAGWRYALLVLGAMVPNILITIGGAELAGWSTHYHAMYIPFLVFAASVGFLALNRRLERKALKIGVPALTALLVIVLAGFFNPYTAGWGKEYGDVGHNRITTTVFRFFLAPQTSGEKAMAHWLRTLDETIPANTKISAIEGVMPALYRSRQVAMYPFGMDAADYLVISGSAANGVPTAILGANNYVDSATANACLAARAAKQGFVFDHDLAAVGVLVFKKAR